MLTAPQLSAIMPALPAARRDSFMPFLQDALQEFSIDPPARTAAFLAQLAHESGQLRFMEEIWGPTAAQRRYEPVTSLSATLGNTEIGDGKRFKGRGPFLFGTFSAADAFYAPVVSRFRTYRVPVSGEAATYASTIWALPAMRRWLEGARAEG